MNMHEFTTSNIAEIDQSSRQTNLKMIASRLDKLQQAGRLPEKAFWMQKTDVVATGMPWAESNGPSLLQPARLALVRTMDDGGVEIFISGRRFTENPDGGTVPAKALRVHEALEGQEKPLVERFGKTTLDLMNFDLWNGSIDPTKPYEIFSNPVLGRVIGACDIALAKSELGPGPTQ